MKVTIEQLDTGEHYFILPEKFQQELEWKEGDTIEWIDNHDGSYLLSNVNKNRTFKEKADSTSDVPEEKK
ncbi:hypothetical protein P7F88_03915 [Vibrio hannami]|uniref:hypothetical protein n=1 Tax=Vibrio hannami TaxID=2717094 RepID=UPI00240F5D32|nr:hypothetical protein [Vibrio hannami]MDG3085294.1 hypothetical protein [Vibrio hannami]